jgi:hypothetical protein
MILNKTYGGGNLLWNCAQLVCPQLKVSDYRYAYTHERGPDKFNVVYPVKHVAGERSCCDMCLWESKQRMR